MSGWAAVARNGLRRSRPSTFGRRPSKFWAARARGWPRRWPSSQNRVHGLLGSESGRPEPTGCVGRRDPRSAFGQIPRHQAESGPAGPDLLRTSLQTRLWGDRAPKTRARDRGRLGPRATARDRGDGSRRPPDPRWTHAGPTLDPRQTHARPAPDPRRTHAGPWPDPRHPGSSYSSAYARSVRNSATSSSSTSRSRRSAASARRPSPAPPRRASSSSRMAA